MVSVFEGELKKMDYLRYKGTSQSIETAEQRISDCRKVSAQTAVKWLKYYILRYMFKKDQMDEYRQIKVQ